MTPRKPRKTPKQTASADSAHDRRIVRRYGLRPGEYAQLLDSQNGVCAVCLRAPGKTRLAVDHDHNVGDPRTSIRGLLCRRCNYNLLGLISEDPAFYRRAAEYLATPPAKKALGL